MDERINKIKRILEESFDMKLDQITADSKFMDDIKLSSLDLIMFFPMVEEEFNVKITDKDMLEITSIKDLLNLIDTKKK